MCKEVEDENGDEDENDWGSGGWELRPTIAGIVCLKAIDQSGQHCYKTREHFLTGFLLASVLPKSSSSSFSSSTSFSWVGRVARPTCSRDNSLGLG
jgi:hypothetical protein